MASKEEVRRIALEGRRWCELDLSALLPGDTAFLLSGEVLLLLLRTLAASGLLWVGGEVEGLGGPAGSVLLATEEADGERLARSW